MSKHAKALKKLRWELVDHDDKAQMDALDYAIGVIEDAADRKEAMRIEGIPIEDGAYWYYKLGEKMPSLVLVGDYKGERAIKDGPAIQREWFPGEFFIGPIQPPVRHTRRTGYAVRGELAESS